MQSKARFIRPVIVAAIMAFLMTAVITFYQPGLAARFSTALDDRVRRGVAVCDSRGIYCGADRGSRDSVDC